MKTQKFVISLYLLAAVFFAACSPQAAPSEVMTEKEMAPADAADSLEEKDESEMEDKSAEMAETSGDAMLDDKDDDMMSAEGDAHQDAALTNGQKGEDMMEDKSEEMAGETLMVPDWHKATLTNARTGEMFTIANLKGKVILVETLAMWCSNCLKQQNQVKALHELIGERDDFVSLGVDIDPNENSAALQAFTDKNGFDWLYIVASPEVSRELGQLYGDQYLNPPSTPMLIVDRQGEVHLLPFGIKNAESLLEALQPFLDNEM